MQEWFVQHNYLDVIDMLWARKSCLDEGYLFAYKYVVRVNSVYAVHSLSDTPGSLNGHELFSSSTHASVWGQDYASHTIYGHTIHTDTRHSGFVCSSHAHHYIKYGSCVVLR